jgi:hypothetical protein
MRRQDYLRDYSDGSKESFSTQSARSGHSAKLPCRCQNRKSKLGFRPEIRGLRKVASSANCLVTETAASWIATSGAIERRRGRSWLGEPCCFNPVSDGAEAEAWPMRPPNRRRRLANASVADWRPSVVMVLCCPVRLAFRSEN